MTEELSCGKVNEAKIFIHHIDVLVLSVLLHCLFSNVVVKN